MGFSSTLVLGLVAGATIVLGLPIGRMRRPAPAVRAFLNAVAVGVLLFLVWDVLTHAWEPVDAALGNVHDGRGGLGAVIAYGTLFVGGLAVGLLSLVAYDAWMGRLAKGVTAAGGAAAGAEGLAPRTPWRQRGVLTWSPARRLALVIAVGIGLHNFAEGLAIGQSAGQGQIALATLLVVGFALHNATEGFGITAPLAGDVDPEGTPRRPSWPFLLSLGAIGGAPTFIGTALGYGFTSEAVSVVFLTLAAGSIIYVVTQLLGVAAKARRTDLLSYGLLLGMIAGFVTDAVVTAGGA